jgi:hypothetical protein
LIVEVSVDWREAVAASLTHAHAEIVKVVGDVELPGSPLVSASWILTGVGTAVDITLGVLVLFCAYVIEVEPVSTAWIVDDHVFKMRDTPEVSELGSGKVRESFVSDTGRAEVVAASGVTSFDQIKSS